MTMQVIGTGVGRTGTYSLKIAIEQLGLGPSHHMEEVIFKLPTQVPLWSEAVAGKPEWSSIYEGYRSAVDWPTAGFFRELYETYPEAKFVLTQRSPESWADSFGETIYQLMAGKDQAPPEMLDWFKMATGVLKKSGFPDGLDRDGLIHAFNTHNEAVKSAIPDEQLLVFDVREGWEPLCTFLDKPVPDEPFPHTNGRSEFWDRIKKEN